MGLGLVHGGTLMGFLFPPCRWSAQGQKQAVQEQVNLVILSGLVAVTLEQLLWAEISQSNGSKVTANSLDRITKFTCS